jgi:hypothetical protein
MLLHGGRLRRHALLIRRQGSHRAMRLFLVPEGNARVVIGVVGGGNAVVVLVLNLDFQRLFLR